jgi:hypothetical protein
MATEMIGTHIDYNKKKCPGAKSYDSNPCSKFSNEFLVKELRPIQEILQEDLRIPHRIQINEASRPLGQLRSS